jgi:DoxX-like family
MNRLLWILQGLLALHTLMGAIWKLSNSEQGIPSLQALPHGLWMALIGVELLCCLGLLVPALLKRLGWMIPVSALVIAAEMLMFCAYHLKSGIPQHGEMIYWLVIAGLCGFIALARIKGRSAPISVHKPKPA